MRRVAAPIAAQPFEAVHIVAQLSAEEPIARQPFEVVPHIGAAMCDRAGERLPLAWR